MSEDWKDKPTVPIVVPDIVGKILDRTEMVQKSIQYLSDRTGDRLNNIENISRRNADALMEVKSDLRNHKNDISGLRAKIVELDVKDKTCPAKEAVNRFDRMFARLDEAQSEDSKIIRIIENRIEDYKNIKRVTGSGPPFKGFWKQNGWALISAVGIAFIVGIGAATIIMWQAFGGDAPPTRIMKPAPDQKGSGADYAWPVTQTQDSESSGGTDR